MKMHKVGRVIALLTLLLLISCTSNGTSPTAEECDRIEAERLARTEDASIALSRLIDVNEQQITNALNIYTRSQRNHEDPDDGGTIGQEEPPPKPGLERDAWDAIIEANDVLEAASQPVGCE